MFCKTFDLATAQVLVLKEQPSLLAPYWKLTQVTEISDFARYHQREIYLSKEELNKAFDAYDKADAIKFYEAIKQMN